MQKKVLYMLAFLLLGVGWASAQVSSVTGTVTSADDGEPVIGASVLVKGTTTGTTTDLEGRFSLTVEGPNVTLVVSYVGYEQMELPAVAGSTWGPQNEVSKGEWGKRLRDREIQKRGCKTNCPRA